LFCGVYKLDYLTLEVVAVAVAAASLVYLKRRKSLNKGL
jgi:hypothetical protein